MSNQEPTKNYIWQPYGDVGFKNPVNAEKMYGVWALENGSQGSIKGLTKKQAQEILAIINETETRASLPLSSPSEWQLPEGFVLIPRVATPEIAKYIAGDLNLIFETCCKTASESDGEGIYESLIAKLAPPNNHNREGA